MNGWPQTPHGRSPDSGWCRRNIVTSAILALYRDRPVGRLHDSLLSRRRTRTHTAAGRRRLHGPIRYPVPVRGYLRHVGRGWRGADETTCRDVRGDLALLTLLRLDIEDATTDHPRRMSADAVELIIQQRLGAEGSQ